MLGGCLKQLTEDQNASKVTIAKEHLRRFNHKFSCKLVPQQQANFMLCRWNTKPPKKMAKVYIYVQNTLQKSKKNFLKIFNVF